MNPDLIGTRVDIYFNLHKHLWSVRDCKTGRVVAHLPTLTLDVEKLHVSPSGNARARERQTRSVHAWIRGTVIDTGATQGPEITYNPFKDTAFVSRDGRHPVTNAKKIYFSTDKHAYIVG